MKVPYLRSCLDEPEEEWITVPTQVTEETPEDQFNINFTGSDFELVNTSLEPSKIQPQLDEEEGETTQALSIEYLNKEKKNWKII